MRNRNALILTGVALVFFLAGNSLNTISFCFWLVGLTLIAVALV